MLPTGTHVTIIGSSLEKLKLSPTIYNAYKNVGFATVLWYLDSIYELDIPGCKYFYYVFNEADLVPVDAEQGKLE